MHFVQKAFARWGTALTGLQYMYFSFRDHLPVKIKNYHIYWSEQDSQRLRNCERERYLRKTIILFYGDVKGCLRDISTKDSWAAWDELLAKIGEAGDAFWTREIGEILNYICLETVFWTLRYTQLFIQKFRNRRGILSYNIEDKFKITNSKSLWVKYINYGSFACFWMVVNCVIF